MAKKLLGQLKLQIPAGQANPSPPVGPALGQRGINIMEFCKAFNAKTQSMEPGLPTPVVIDYYQDKSFTFVTKTPPTSFLIRQAAGLDKASQNPGREEAGSITWAQVTEIAESKLPDLNAIDIEGAKLQVAGTARSMGIAVS